MNGIAFADLKKLKTVNLGRNQCINENFNDPINFDNLAIIVSSKCGYKEKV